VVTLSAPFWPVIDVIKGHDRVVKHPKMRLHIRDLSAQAYDLWLFVGKFKLGQSIKRSFIFWGGWLARHTRRLPFFPVPILNPTVETTDQARIIRISWFGMKSLKNLLFTPATEMFEVSPVHLFFPIICKFLMERFHQKQFPLFIIQICFLAVTIIRIT
jgi:hypothetical protein